MSDDIPTETGILSTPLEPSTPVVYIPSQFTLGQILYKVSNHDTYFTLDVVKVMGVEATVVNDAFRTAYLIVPADEAANMEHRRHWTWIKSDAPEMDELYTELGSAKVGSGGGGALEALQLLIE